MRPYTYASGELHGDELAANVRPDLADAPNPGAAPVTRSRRSSSLARRARRARTDPDWATRSEESKRLLLDVDARDERGAR
ncbi:MAG: hypothetical protein ACTHNS_16255 [Marmoricola sp.]